MSSWLWSPAVMMTFAWSASHLLPGEVISFAVVSVMGMFLWVGGAGPMPIHPLCHPDLGLAIADLLYYALIFLGSLYCSHH